MKLTLISRCTKRISSILTSVNVSLEIQKEYSIALIQAHYYVILMGISAQIVPLISSILNVSSNFHD